MENQSKKQSPWAIIKEFIRTHKHMFLVLLWLVYSIWYFILNKLDLNFHEIHLPIDDKIPFLEPFVIFYVLWYVYIAFALVYTLIKSKKDFLTMIALVFTSLVASLIVCTVYPTKITFRPDAPPGNNVFSWMIKIIYATDKPHNVFPSIHCITTIVITVGFVFAESMKGKTLAKILLGLFTAGVCLSTVFIKQHSFADFLLAAGMCIPICLFIYLVFVPHLKSDLPKKVAEPVAPSEELPAEDPAVKEEESVPSADDPVLESEPQGDEAKLPDPTPNNDD